MKRTMGFTTETNKAFLESREFLPLRYLRSIFAVFVVAYGFFSLTDIYYFPEAWRTTFLIRFGVVIPMLVSVIAMSYHDTFQKTHQWLISTSFVLGGIGIAVMLILVPENVVYYGGLFLVYFSGYFMIKLRYVFATVSGWTIFAFHFFGYWIIHGELTIPFLAGMFFFVCANLIGMSGAYHFEMMNRRKFLHDRQILEINNQLILQVEEKNKQYEELLRSIEEKRELTFRNQEKDRLTALLKQSAEQYQLLATQMPLGLALHEIILDKEGHPIDYRFLSANEAYEHITGLSRKDILGKTLLQVLPQTEKIWIEAYGKVALTGESTEFEEFAAALSRHFHVHAYSPKRGQFAVIVEDITERKTFQRKLQEREKDLVATQTIAKIGSWRLDVRTNEVLWTEQLYHMYGFDPALPVPPYPEHMKLFTPDSWNRLSSALEATARYGVPYELELQMVTKDGSAGWMWVHGEAEKDAYGQISHIWGAAQDITERVKMTHQLTESQQRFQALFEQSPLSIELFDANGVLMYANEASIRLFGVVDKKDLVKSTLFDNPNLPPDAAKRLLNKESVHSEIQYDFDKVRLHKRYRSVHTGIRTLNVTITPLFVEGTLNGYLVQSEDITEERAKQKEIEHLSYHDYLTNAFNRRYLVDTFASFVQAKRFPLGIVMMDVNGLKIVNDAYGHSAGDAALVSIARALKDYFGTRGVVCRIGGDEFAAIVPNTSTDMLQEDKAGIEQILAARMKNHLQITLAIGFDIAFGNDKGLDNLLMVAENKMYRHKLSEASSVRSRAIQAIMQTLSEKYQLEKNHSARVSRYAGLIGEALHLKPDDIKELKLAGLFHDIGKISIPDHILNKPEPLTAEEYDTVKEHTETGYQILRAADEYSDLAIHALHHHERWNGTGYPKGLKGLSIPLFSRIIGVADAYEAMTSDRPYRKALTTASAIEELEKHAGKQFDPDIVRVFVNDALPQTSE